jgi:hypothetical protein
MSFSVRSATVCLSLLVGACAPIPVNSPMVLDKLKLISAGYTGCVPDENTLTNATASLDGSGQWNATCKGQTWLCTSVGQVDGGAQYHCAPAQ